MNTKLGIVLLSFLLCASNIFAANNKVYTNPETANNIIFADAAQSPTATLTMANLATGTGRYSDRYDRGAGAHAATYEWRCTISLTGTNVADQVIEWYISTSDGTHADGELGTTDAAIASGSSKRNNLLPAGMTVIDQTTTNTNMTASGRVYIPSRYFSWVIWNGSTLSLQNSTSVHMCLLTPIPLEIQ